MENGLKFYPLLRDLRKTAGSTLRESAEKTNVSFTYPGNTENGILPPSGESYIQLAMMLDFEQDKLPAPGGIAP
jgi:transcriptional regulator with XRE-family HTH domain